jgi:hypothetical protein
MSIRQKLSSRWTTVLVIVAALWLSIQAAGLWNRSRQANQELARLSDRATQLERDIADQERSLELTRDSYWLRYQARLRLNYQLSDEKVAVVYRKENPGIIAPVVSRSATVEDMSWWERLMGWLGDIGLRD